MVRYEIQVEDDAKADIRKLMRYIVSEFQEPEIADRMKRRIYQECASLNFMPKRYSVSRFPALARLGYRVTSVGKYLILYTVNDSTRSVHIKRVVYGGQDWPSLFQNPT